MSTLLSGRNTVTMRVYSVSAEMRRSVGGDCRTGRGTIADLNVPMGGDLEQGSERPHCCAGALRPELGEAVSMAEAQLVLPGAGPPQLQQCGIRWHYVHSHG